MRIPKLYVLGAGFSKPAGLPLGTEIFSYIIEESKKTIIYENVLSNDIRRYLEYTNRTKDQYITENDIILEDFLSFLDIEHFLKLRGRDHWSETGNRSQIAIRNIIAKVLYREREQIYNLDVYLEFCKRLNPGDVVITFNFDTILETVLTYLKKLPVFSFDDRDNFGIEIDNLPITILKLHGSIDWYSIEPYLRDINTSIEDNDFYYESTHPIFSHSHEYMPKRVFRHPSNPYSPLRYIYCPKEIKSLQRYDPSVTENPVIISPSYTKIVYLNTLSDLWYGLNGIGNHCESLTIIGFSIPGHDEYIRQVLYNIIDNYQNQEDLKGIYTKPPLRLIDKVTSDEGFSTLKNRYSFLNFDEILFYGDGFCIESIN